MTNSRRLGRIPRPFVVVLIAAGSLLGLLGTATSADATVVDPYGSGSSASKTIGCDSQSHKLWVHTVAYSDQTVIMRRIWVRYRQSSTWHVFRLGAVDAAGWTGVSSSTWEGYDMSSLAGSQLEFSVEYGFQPLIGEHLPWKYGSETPGIEYYNPSDGTWHWGSYCSL